MLCAGLISFTMTPAARVLAYKLGAIDVPKDERRMHNKPIPRLGGIAVFIGFSVSTMVFCDVTPSLLALWFGGLIIVVLGILDDIFRLRALIKFVVQIGVAFVAVSQGLTISFINLFGNYITLGIFEIPVTIIWIVGLTNAINLIDGLDGLSCGISAICSFSLLLCTIMLGENPEITLLTGILAASCLGFLPFNTNPAKIFIGDTGALFLGYTLSILSLQGLFKTHTILSFMIPLSIFGFPLFETVFSFLRRILHGKNPFAPDRGHIHHKLIDFGFNQKQSVGILYSVCGILGTSAVMFTSEDMIRAGIIIIAGFSVFIINYFMIKNPKTRELAGINFTQSNLNIKNETLQIPNSESVLEEIKELQNENITENINKK